MERNRKTGRLSGPRLNIARLLALTTALAVALAAGPAALATDITIDPQPTPTHGRLPIPPDQGGGNQGPVLMVTPAKASAGIVFSKLSVRVTEGGATDTYGVKLKSDPGPGKTVTISIASSDGEVTVSPTSLEFTHDNWNEHQYVTVTAIDDTEVEGDHGDVIQHTASENYGGGHLREDLDVDITDNDGYGPVLSETDGSTAVAEGGTEADTYTIALPSEPRRDVTVTITPDSQVTVNGHDHPITATFDKDHWRDTVTVYVRAVDDSLVEGTPHFGMITNVLSSDDERFDGGREDLTVSITDNDVPARTPGTPAFEPSNYEVTEGAAGGVVIISVTRTGGTEGAMTVSYATSDGTATSPGDYASTTGTITWPDGSGGEKTFTVPIVNDSIHEPAETFNLNLYLDSIVYPEEEAGETAVAETASHGAVAAEVSVGDIKPPSYGADRHAAEVTEEPVSTAAVTIIDDDPPDFGSADFTHESYTVDESEGSVTIGVERLGGHDGILTVRYETAATGAATPDVDYSPTTDTLEWGDGEEGVREFSVGIIDDSDHENDESFEVRLYFVSAVEPDGSGPEEAEPIASATVTILDDDAPVFGTAEFTAETYEASEASGSVTIGARRVGGTDGVLIVRYATGDGTATSPDDYAATTGTLEWGDGEGGIRTFTVPIANDSLHEHDETFGLTLSFVEAFEPMIDVDGEEPVIDSATVTIIDDDPPDFGSARFTKETYEVTEGCGAATFEVERTGGTDGVLTAHWATSDGSAHSPADYAASSGDITWEAGETGSRTISVVIGNDSVHRPDRSFNLTLTYVEAHEVEPLSEPGDVLDTATVVIREDDAPVTGSVRFTDDRFVVVEDEGPVAITVERYGGSDDVLTVEFATSDGSAKCPVDYEEADTTLTWDDGETGIMTVYVDIRNDRREEETQSFHVKLYRGETPTSPAGNAETVGQPAVIDSADVVIIDDDPPVAEEEEEEVTALGVKCCEPPAAATSLPEFADLIGHWGRGDCQLAAALGIVAGSADGLFRPDGVVTRAEYVTFLARTTGCPPTDEPVPFTDVSRGDWFYADLAKEVRNGVVVGFSDGTFRPNEPITREEAALMLSRAMTHCGWPKPADATVWDTLARYADGDLVSPAARAGVALAVSSEMWVGRGGLALMPQATLTRAEAAAMMVRLWRWLVTLP